MDERGKEGQLTGVDLKLYDGGIVAADNNTEAFLGNDHCACGKLLILVFLVLGEGLVICLVLACETDFVAFIDRLPVHIEAWSCTERANVGVWEDVGL